MRTVTTEKTAMDAMAAAFGNGLAAPFAKAVSLISASAGRIIVTGVGKSGHVAAKIASTLASTGTPAFFVHPVEAVHGDLGMISRDDVVLAMSWSGETAELKGVIDYSRRFSIPLIAVTAGVTSSLARASDAVLALPRVAEACPHGLAPTSSSIIQMALGDCLAIALLEARGFTPDHFRALHPGGQLGANLTLIRDVMHAGDKVPLVDTGTGMREAILEISAKGFGCVGVVDRLGRLAGIITDGDLRRHISADLLSMPVDEVMTHRPRTVTPDTLASSAMAIINESSITTLLVVDAGHPVGIIHLHDLLRIGVA
ncbi:MAG: KpsF/GutQ family sugar-phosphate isomerase [Rhizobiaceae bacterium]